MRRVQRCLQLWVTRPMLQESVIDECFAGEVVVKLYNLGKTPYEFQRGDKIIQLVVMSVSYPEIVQVEEIASGERGANGYGSTGK